MPIGSSVRLTTSDDVRQMWSARTEGAGWTFPSDWHTPAVDALCEAISAGHDAWAPAERLGQDRGTAGVSLAETLADIDVLAAISPQRYTAPLRRAVSLGWADRVTAPPAAVCDPMTGLVTAEYLQVRLQEIYAEAEVAGRDVGRTHALVLIRLDLTKRSGWQRVLPMILAADAMRAAFSGGQSLAQLGPSVAVALAPREPLLARRALLLAEMIAGKVADDPDAAIPPPHVWIEKLPSSHRAALDLLGEWSR